MPIMPTMPHMNAAPDSQFSPARAPRLAMRVVCGARFAEVCRFDDGNLLPHWKDIWIPPLCSWPGSPATAASSAPHLSTYRLLSSKVRSSRRDKAAMLMTATASSAKAGYSIGMGFDCILMSSLCPSIVDLALSG